MTYYLVTGGAGFIGSNFINYMIKNYNNICIINIDMLSYASNLSFIQNNINDSNKYIFINEDINNKNKILDLFFEYKIDYIINFASHTHVDRSIEDITPFIHSNINGLNTLLNASLKFHGKLKEYPKKIIHISTDEVYGSAKTITDCFDEQTSLSPTNPYSATKASSEFIALSYLKTHNLPIDIIRPSNNFGPNQFYEKLIPKTIVNAINEKEIPIYGSGLNIRNWLFVEDNCRAIDIVMKNHDFGNIYNVSSEDFFSNINIVKYIINILNSHFGYKISQNIISFVEDRKSHDFMYSISNKKISNLGWSYDKKFKEKMIKTISFYIENCKN